MSDIVIKTENIYKTYKDVEAVKNVSFSVEDMTCFGILGPNGAGKTTIMKMIYGKALRDNPDKSVINVFGFDPQKESLNIKSISGVTPQDNNLDEQLNVSENLQVYARFYGVDYNTASGRIDELLEFMELKEKKRSLIKELSGGMKRRLVIVRALLNKPKILILDEPTTGLDPQVRHIIWEKIRDLKKQGTTILLTTHYMEEAFQICDKILIMDKGMEIISGIPRKLLEENIEGYVAEIPFEESVIKIKGNIDRNKVREDNAHGLALFYGDDLEYLKSLVSGLQFREYYLRQCNLEDLFLKYTGRELNEGQ